MTTSAISGDRLVAIIFLVLCIAYGIGTFSFYQTLSEDVIGPAYFPRILAIAGAFLAVLYLIQSNRKAHGTPESEFTGTFGISELWPIGFVLAYALLLSPLGFVPATFLFFTATMFGLGEPIRPALIYAILTTTVLFILFFVFLKAELPMGTILPLDQIFPQINDLRRLWG